MATNRGGGDDKSWADIAGDALEIAKTAFNKAATGVKDTVGKLLPRKEEPTPRSTSFEEPYRDPFQPRGRTRGGDLYRQDDSLFGSMLGRAAGSLLGGVMGQVGEMMAESSRQAAGAKQQALSMIQSDSEVRSALGEGVQIMPGMDSQATSTSIINGRATKQTSLSFLVAGRTGQAAQAQVQVTGKPDGSEDVKVTVRLPDGRLVPVSGGKAGGSSGPTIDVDWRDVS